MTAIGTCLLIDDDTDEHEIFSMALESIEYGGKLETATNGPQALESLREYKQLRPDFIFLDLNMPRMNGLQCLTEIRKYPHLQHIPIVIFSTSAVPEVIKSAEELGAFAFIKKPYSIGQLADALRDFFKQFD